MSRTEHGEQDEQSEPGDTNTAAPLPLPSCLACGTCCFSTLDTYVRVTGDDYERLGDDAEALTHFVGTRCFLRMVDGHCAALRIDVERAEYVCSIYDRRPETCRALDRGSSECLGERATKGDRPLVALRRERGT